MPILCQCQRSLQTPYSRANDHNVELLHRAKPAGATDKGFSSTAIFSINPDLTNVTGNNGIFETDGDLMPESPP